MFAKIENYVSFIKSFWNSVKSTVATPPFSCYTKKGISEDTTTATKSCGHYQEFVQRNLMNLCRNTFVMRNIDDKIYKAWSVRQGR